MGVTGWQVLGENVTIEGTVTAVDDVALDGDWCFWLLPAPGFEFFLRNPHGHRNGNGRIECEVEPVGRVGGQDAESDAVVHRHLDELRGQHVRVTGTWVRDNGHDVNGGDIFPGGDVRLGKTEVHPVSSIVLDRPIDAELRRVVVFAFADDSWNPLPGGLSVPNSGISRSVSIVLPAPAGTTVRTLEEIRQAQSISHGVVPGAFTCSIVTGAPGAATGFYKGVFELRRPPVTAAGGGWAPFGTGTLAEPPASAQNADGRLELAARRTSGGAVHRWQTARSNGWSGDWADFGVAATSAIAFGRNPDGRLEAFARGPNGTLVQRWQTAPSNGWSGWATTPGAIVGAPAVGRQADGRLAVFAVAGGGRIVQRGQTAPNNGWSDWQPLGDQVATDVLVASNKSGRLEVFARAPDGSLHHCWQTAPNAAFSGWARFGDSSASAPVVGASADGRLEVFVAGPDGSVWHRWQTAPDNGWSQWAPRNFRTLGRPAVARNADGRLELFAWGTDNQLHHQWQMTPGGSWSAWAALGGTLASSPSVAVNADGRLEVFALDQSRVCRHRWQTAPGSGWSG